MSSCCDLSHDLTLCCLGLSTAGLDGGKWHKVVWGASQQWEGRGCCPQQCPQNMGHEQLDGMGQTETPRICHGASKTTSDLSVFSF